MLTNTVTVLETDGTKMQGLHSKSIGTASEIVIHVHGMAGNFYENSFIEVIAATCNENGIDFLAFNNRGHDYLADCERITSEGIESYSAGGAYENFSDCVFDLKGVLKWAVSEGYSSIYLEGHSSGANKIAFSYDALISEKIFANVLKGIILISPCDDVGIYHSEVCEEERDNAFLLAKKYINEGNGTHLMPLGTFFDYLLSAETFVDCFSEGSALDMFPYRLGSLINSRVSKISLPMLIQFGNNGDFVLQDFDQISNMYSELEMCNFKLQIVDGASHNYKNCEEILATNIVNWIKDLLK